MSGANGTPAVPIPLTGVQVAIRTDREQYSTPRTSHYSSYLNIDEEMHEKPQGQVMGPDDFMEIGVEKWVL